MFTVKNKPLIAPGWVAKIIYLTLTGSSVECTSFLENLFAKQKTKNNIKEYYELLLYLKHK